MATITIQVVTVADGTLTKSLTIPEAQATRMIAAYQSGANIDINGTATRVQVWNYIFKVIVAEWRRFVKSYETQVTTTSAAAGVTDISIT